MLRIMRSSPSPTALREWFRFFFYANEGNEAPHVHVKTGSGEVKFWLYPHVTFVGATSRTSRQDIRKALHRVRRNREEIHEEWKKFFRRK